jgi:hypothetical protein
MSIKIYDKKINPIHPIRRILASFWMKGLNEPHGCQPYEPYRRRFKNGGVRISLMDL